MFSKFYERYPNFNWKFYVVVNKDLQKAGIKTEEHSIYHYLNYGIKEHRRTHAEIVQEEELTYIDFDYFMTLSNQCYFSKGVSTFKNRVKKKYSLVDYNDKNKPCFFFGIYNNEDLNKLKNHKSLRIIIWCGEDTNRESNISRQTIKEVKLLKNMIHLSKSKSTYNNLKYHDIDCILTKYNVVDKTLFKPISKKKLGNSIFIFNGQSKGREHIYGKKIYQKVMERLPQFNYILSNTLNLPWEKMPEIYKQCFIMLRLTSNDGNANSVQECEAMNIPVLHNQSDYGIKWKSEEDIITVINNEYENKIKYNKFNNISVILKPSQSKKLNPNEKLFKNFNVSSSNIVMISEDKFNNINELIIDFEKKQKNITNVFVLLDNYGTFVEKNIKYILNNKQVNFYILENDIHYLRSKKQTYARYNLLRKNLLNNQHIYILAFYWYHYKKLYKISYTNLIPFPRFVYSKSNILQINEKPIMKVLLSGSLSNQYPMRRYLKSIKHKNVKILNHEDNVRGDDYYKFINKYICAFNCCSNSKTPYIVSKFFEIPATGSLLLAYDEYVKNPLKQIGFIDGVNYISCNKENIIDKINYICDTKNIEKINSIRIKGQELVLSKHMLKNREELIKNIIKYQ